MVSNKIILILRKWNVQRDIYGINSQYRWEKSRDASSLSNSIFYSAYIRTKDKQCVTHALRVRYASRPRLCVCTSRGRSEITCGSTAFDNLTAFCNLSFYLLSIHHLAFPILGRSSIGIRFTGVTVKSRTFRNEKCIYRCNKMLKKKPEKIFSYYVIVNF